MSIQKIVVSYTAVLLWLVIPAPTLASSINDFNTWMQVEDPDHPGMTGSVSDINDLNPNQATLTAIGPIPAGTDIGYQSVNGNNVAGSSSGNYFSASQDFHIAIDFNLDGIGSKGFAAIGFGIGEDGAGVNSTGPVLAISDGVPITILPAFSVGARVNDVTQFPISLGLPGTTIGRFFVRYNSATGDVISGVNSLSGSNAPSVTATFGGFRNNWNLNDPDLLASFFLRSDDPLIFSQLTSGTVTAVFSNFQVLQGTPVSAVPLPAAVWLFCAALGGLLSCKRRRQFAE